MGDWGCITPSPNGMLVCACPPPPPPPGPPVVGSPEWVMQNKFEDPGAAAAAGPNLAMYEAGNVAVNLNKYLQAQSEKAAAQAEMGQIILKDLKAVSTDSSGKKGLFGLGFFGL